ncbi:hypothetical protein [Halogeometricum limi]|uniref:Uncharacterized protein n=1 Tax=Halogeometricum limi TaxID=555875 RepID=A0A1I6HYF7_9EURY|nr:hypothetical protein [Halogeometricum limi]SFR59467.1 hypothetical protein SAMN04488124_2605 [Halogeometricum limi]
MSEEDAELPEELRDEEPDWEMSPDSDAAFDPDADRRELLRDVAEDVYGDSSESRQLSAILYRVSDLYDPDEDTSPEEIYLNVRHIMDIKAKGGLRTE